ncbi:MAG TPA: hypothetical protein VNW68_01155 [Candidatus Limnocylindria bacterium]|jgi:hypothetical protein|nr:hypothetical protein [Candidatus Limnocylindria bacterium]
MASSKPRPAYAPPADWLKPRAPALYRVLQLLRRAAADVWRHRAWSFPLVVVPAAATLFALASDEAVGRPILLLGAALAWLAAALCYVAIRVHQIANGVTNALDQLAKSRTQIVGRLDLVDQRLTHTASDAEPADPGSVLATIEVVRAAAQAGESELRMRLDRLATDLAELQAELAAIRRGGGGGHGSAADS